MTTILIVPGLRNSGPTHWQSWFEEQLTNTRRVEQADWEKTCLSDWAARVGEEIDVLTESVWIVAHSFGCLASVTASLTRPERIRGALLVAPADPDRFGEPAALLEEKLLFPSLVVSSSNDPWVKAPVAEYWARQWGSEYRNIGEAGHINVDSGHGPWPDGLRLFEQLRGA
uniref:Alpha/beta hydrolase n=1 Tax=Dechloromonas aromatica (strain RCB) TaxID=159087 RepID=Q47E57_DECAR